MHIGCGHGDQFQVYTRKKGLVWSKVQGSKQVVLGGELLPYSYSPHFLSLPHWGQRTGVLLGSITNRSGDFPLKKTSQLSHTLVLSVSELLCCGLTLISCLWMCKRAWVFVHFVRGGTNSFSNDIVLSCIHLSGSPSVESTQPSRPSPLCPLITLDEAGVWLTYSVFTQAGRAAFYPWDIGNRKLCLCKHMNNKNKNSVSEFWALYFKTKGFWSFDPFKFSCLLISLWEECRKSEMHK